jgi:Hypothetical glycosyl hydrolase family 15
MRKCPRRIAIGVLFVLLGACCCAPVAAAAAGSSGEAGRVKFVKRTDSSFDRFTSAPTAAFTAWMNQNFWRAEVFSPYFDDKTAWYPHGWTYRDLYALYNGSSFASSHPEWILRDAAGNRLYIPYGCSGGTCPQYAADIGSPSFRQAWIANAKAEVAKGYAGLWIDDVNLEMRVGDGAEHEVAPIDPRTGLAMTSQIWREYVATFVEEIRRALPGVEIVHNSIWFAGGAERDSNQFVRREIAAADYINLERGVNDPGLTGGPGQWSLQALLSFIDRVHAAGKGVILDGGDSIQAGREYSLASYFLISSGNDGVGLGSMTPENWWSAFNIDLGAAEGQRVSWQGLLRRDYSNGLVLVNEPQTPTRTVALPRPMLTTTGAVVSSVTLAAGQGAVLRYANPAAAAPAQANAAVAAPVGSSISFRLARSDHGAKVLRASGPAIALAVQVRVHRGAATAFVRGHLSAATGGRMRVRLQTRRHGRWVRARALSRPLRAGGLFYATLNGLHAGRYRIRAIYAPPSATSAPRHGFLAK